MSTIREALADLAENFTGTAGPNLYPNGRNRIAAARAALAQSEHLGIGDKTAAEAALAQREAQPGDWRTGAIAYLRAAAEDRARKYANVPDMLRGADIIERLANELEALQQASPYGLDCASQQEAQPMCPCKDRPAAECPGEWEPGCDLGANEKFVKRVQEAQPVPEPLSEAEIQAIYQQYGTGRLDGFAAAAHDIERIVIERMQGVCAARDERDALLLAEEAAKLAFAHLLQEKNEIARSETSLRRSLEIALEQNRALRRALFTAEAALSDIGDADREPGDNLAWCERRAAEHLPEIRAALAARKDGIVNLPMAQP